MHQPARLPYQTFTQSIPIPIPPPRITLTTGSPSRVRSMTPVLKHARRVVGCLAARTGRVTPYSIPASSASVKPAWSHTAGIHKSIYGVETRASREKGVGGMEEDRGLEGGGGWDNGFVLVFGD
ncbi:hypothetical protein GMDG_02057 [Pseudogymnoascus destructans 20631-21]|uniref:Uncharacterized protein n=1 Tax=Pseudogymnoascus destructans (strain ATCC MYA-4855 / 20631-21) TaxID=658429 RepID=L8G0L9_PSED2|nr:hypothetical protein GMDG_02057 [Pseudogymnoascus destructans 20631-21]